MTDKITQKARVRNRLARYGEVSNLWAWQNGIWRLADIILDLRREGMSIVTEFGTKKVGKNCHYRLAAATQ